VPGIVFPQDFYCPISCCTASRAYAALKTPVCTTHAAVKVLLAAAASQIGVFFIKGRAIQPAHDGKRPAYRAITLAPCPHCFPGAVGYILAYCPQDSGKNKFKSTVKDGAFIGSNSNLVAPVTVEEKGYVATGSTITEDVPQGALAIAREREVIKEGWVAKKEQKDKTNN